MLRKLPIWFSLQNQQGLDALKIPSRRLRNAQNRAFGCNIQGMSEESGNLWAS